MPHTIVMPRIHFKKILPHVLLITGSLIFVGVLFALAAIEQAQTRDIQRMQQALGLKNALAVYYQYHASYPNMPGSDTTVGSAETNCLSDNGFVSLESQSCQKKMYGAPLPPISAYQAYADDEKTHCAENSGCAHFAITVNFETSLLYPKGTHILTDQGMN